jgi:hypothetical protein
MSRRIMFASLVPLILVATAIVVMADPPVVAAEAIGVGWGQTIIVGASTGGTSGGTTGSGGTAAGPGKGGPSGGGGQKSAVPSCIYDKLVLNDEGFAPGGPTPGSWYSVMCFSADGTENIQTEWIADQAAPATPPVDPRSLALAALKSLALPLPVTHFNPAGASVVNLPTWLWIDGALWHPLSVSASAGPVTATAVATPVSVTWSMGDGGTTTCAGPGQPFTTAGSAALPSSRCTYTYRTSSAGQSAPDGDLDQGAYPVVATVTWAVSWSTQGAAGGGPLPTLFSSTVARVRVEQVQSINSEDGQALGAAPTLRHLS